MNGPQGMSTTYGIARYNAGFHSEAANKGKKPAKITVIGPPFGKYDHAGINETSWMLYLRPDHTDLSLIRPDDYSYCWREGRESNKATYEWGKTMTEETVKGFLELIKKESE